MNKADRQWAEEIIARIEKASERISVGEQKERTDRAKAQSIADIACAVAEYKPEGAALDLIKTAMAMIGAS